eukprot:3544343-Karenia_brevis.AAC.1
MDLRGENPCPHLHGRQIADARHGPRQAMAQQRLDERMPAHQAHHGLAVQRQNVREAARQDAGEGIHARERALQ